MKIWRKLKDKIKNFIYAIFISLIILFGGCAEKKCTPVVEVKEVKVPVYPDIPKIECEFSGEGFEPIEKMIECLSLHKSVLDKLRNRN